MAYPKELRRKVTVDGVTFTSWQVGANQYEMRTDDGCGRVGRYWHRTTYYAVVANATLPPRFRSEKTAQLAVVKAIKAREAFKNAQVPQ